jgi:hypothetical protein
VLDGRDVEELESAVLLGMVFGTCLLQINNSVVSDPPVVPELALVSCCIVEEDIELCIECETE